MKIKTKSTNTKLGTRPGKESERVSNYRVEASLVSQSIASIWKDAGETCTEFGFWKVNWVAGEQGKTRDVTLYFWGLAHLERARNFKPILKNNVALAGVAQCI